MFRKKKAYVTRVEKGHSHAILKNYMANKLAVVAAVVLILIILGSLLCDVFFDYDTQCLGQNPRIRNQGPSAEHWFGTDNFGRDLFVRVLYGSRYSLIFGFGCTAMSLLLGCLLGATAAYYGGKWDAIIMRILDAIMCIPSLLLMLLMVAVMGGNMESLVISITISSVPGFTRMIRSVVLSVVQQDFVEAARSCGTKDSQIVLQHVLPNAIGPIIVNGMMNIAGIIMSAAGLSYIGMGIQPPAPEWGNMLSEAMKGIRNYPHLAIFPGLAIVITALCFNLVGDGLADAIDPRRRQ